MILDQRAGAKVKADVGSIGLNFGAWIDRCFNSDQFHGQLFGYSPLRRIARFNEFGGTLGDAEQALRALLFRRC